AEGYARKHGGPNRELGGRAPPGSWGLGGAGAPEILGAEGVGVGRGGGFGDDVASGPAGGLTARCGPLPHGVEPWVECTSRPPVSASTRRRSSEQQAPRPPQHGQDLHRPWGGHGRSHGVKIAVVPVASATR